MKGKRTTVKEVNSWFKRLPENKWRKNYSVDSRRISYFVNNHGLSEEECREMPKSLKKKSENASYKREQRYAEKYIEHLESKNLQESIDRQIIREMITEMTAKQHDWIAVDPTPKSLKKHFPKAQWIKKRQLVKLVEPINTQDEMKVIKVELPGNQKREVYVINIDFSSKKSHLGNR
jgi:arginine utilization protein RocB